MDFLAKGVTDKGGNSFVEVTIKEEDGRVVKRTLEISTFLNAMGASIKKDVPLVHIKPGFFPRNYLSLDFGNYEHFDVSFVVPAKKRVFVYQNGKHYHIPYPKLLFEISRCSYSNITGRVFAMRKNGKELYHYPFGNVSDYGNICMGNIDLKSIESIDDYVEEFFLGVTNDDYIGNKARVVPSYSQTQLLEHLEKLDEFPDKWLVECPTLYEDIVTVA